MNVVLTRELVELKYKTLIQRINMIYNILKIFPVSINCVSEIRSIEVIRQQYERMYKEVIRKNQYEKYEEIENIIIGKIAKIESELDRKIYQTVRTHKNILNDILQNIIQSPNCKEFHNLDEEIEKIKWTKELLKRYIPYISVEDRKEIEEKITTCKFKLLLRREIEQTIMDGEIQCSTVFLEQIVAEIQKIYDYAKTDKIKQMIYDINEDDMSRDRTQLKKVLKDVATEMERECPTLRIEQLVLEEIFEKIRKSANYKEFHNLDEELEKISWIKKMLEQYKSDLNDRRMENAIAQVSTFKFELLVRRQVEQMVYENGGKTSSLLRYDTTEEQECFEKLLRKTISKVGKGNITLEGLYVSGFMDDAEGEKNLFARKVIEDNILLNHLIFRLLEKEIETDAKKYIELLNAPVFNPHLCNIANDPYNQKISYGTADRIGITVLRRSKVNLSLLLSVLKEIISDKNTTIMECDNLYRRFGFECRPIVINEGQEIIRRIYDKEKYTMPPKRVDWNKTRGQLCKIYLTGYNYDFIPNESSFLTNAQIRNKWRITPKSELFSGFWGKEYDRMQKIEELMGEKTLTLKEQRRIETERNVIGRGSNIYDNGYNFWEILPLEECTNCFDITRLPPGKGYSTTRKPLWKSYQKDFSKLDIRVELLESIREYERQGAFFKVCINLDDIAGLPIDFEKIHILTEEEIQKIEQEGEDR